MSTTFPLVWDVFIFIIGLCLGSFLNVCIWRIPKNESVIFPPSHCPNCHKTIKWCENIPIVSWLFLKGRCSSCKQPISFRYVFVEVLTAILLLIIWFKIRTMNHPFILLCVYVNTLSLLVITFFVDLKHKIIPNQLLYLVGGIGIVLVIIFPEVAGLGSRYFAFLNAITGFIVAGGSMAIFYFIGKKLFKKEILGFGDVKFIATIGLCLGAQSFAWFFVVLVASCLGTIFGLILICFKNFRWSNEIPFGPFLAIAGYIWIIFGKDLWHYLL